MCEILGTCPESDGGSGIAGGTFDLPLTPAQRSFNEIIAIYEQRIPKGICKTGPENNIRSWMDNKYDKFKCGMYQSSILDLLNRLKFSDKPEERALLDDWDYGPVQALFGGHQAVIIYPKGANWMTQGFILDPWIKQDPAKGVFDVLEWSLIWKSSDGPSSLYKNGPYPIYGNDYKNPKYVPDYTGEQVGEKPRGGATFSWCPLNLWVEDADGRRSGFPQGVPTWEMPEVSFVRVPLVDGTYWTELDYPSDRNYRLIMEGTGIGEADIFLGFSSDVDDKGGIYRYSLNVTPGEIYEVSADTKGGPLQSEGGVIVPEIVQDIDQAWLASKPDVISTAEYTVISDTEYPRGEQGSLPGVQTGGKEPESCGWSGTWDISYGGPLVLQQTGDTVTGTYPYEEGELSGTIAGNELKGTWTQVRGGEPIAGDYEFEMADDCTFTGRWRYTTAGYSDDWRYDWPGVAKRRETPILNDDPGYTGLPTTRGPCYALPYPDEGEERIFAQDACSRVSNSPPNPTVFSIDEPRTITKIGTYHWNYASGDAPGTIGLKDQFGDIYGPWQAQGEPGMNGIPNAYWTVYLSPGVDLPAGTYTVIDSNPATWSYNYESGNSGIVEVIGLKDHLAGQDCSWTGTWDISYGGPLVLQQTGDTVTGTYPYEEGKLSGTIAGNELKGTWTQVRGGEPIAGDYEFEMADDCTFTGRWRYTTAGYSDDWRYDWPGVTERME
ncbi:MAG TPA: hypothetical protein PLY09_06810 [Methanothrix sp.]|nr:hypothetical protein [Methanothrix sp.]